MFFKQTQILQEGSSERHVFSRRSYLFVEQTLLSHRTDTNFPRNPYLVLEQIQIFHESDSDSETKHIKSTLSTLKKHNWVVPRIMPFSFISSQLIYRHE